MESAPSSLGDHPRVEEPSRAIDCPVSVLQNLRAAILEQFNSSPHGGRELVGVLFGTHQGAELRIAMCCTGASENGGSPGGTIEETKQAISGVIAASHQQQELAGKEPVGWFRAHPRSDLNLTEADVEMANALFPQPWQVALVMRPANSATTRVRFYFREHEGPWTAECAVREFTLPPAELASAPAYAALPAPGGEGAGGELAPIEPPQPPMSSLLDQPERRSGPRFPIAAIVAALALAAGGAYYYYGFSGPRALGLSVQATDSPSQVRVAWNRMSAPVRDARSGYLEIADGGESERVDLDHEQLQIGYVNHQRRSGAVTVRLVVAEDGGPPAEETAQFAGPAAQQLVADNTAASPQNAAPTEAAPAQEQKTQEIVVPVPVETDEPEAPEERPKFQPPAAKQPSKTGSGPAMVEAPPQVAAPTQAVHNEPASLAVAIPHSAPPPEKPAPVRPAAANPTNAALQTAQVPARPAAMPRPAAAPASGRVIWIGRLQKNQPLTITGKGSSIGTLIGELPGRSFKFSVSPGDLSNDGIVLYSSNMEYANSVVEPPGAENGWNKTVYTWNPKFANDISIDESPNAQNGWSRMVLHTRSLKISVIVIDWRAVN